MEYLIELKDEVKIEVEDMGVKEKVWRSRSVSTKSVRRTEQQSSPHTSMTLCQILSDTKGMMLDSTLCDSGAVLRAAPDAGNPV